MHSDWEVFCDRCGFRYMSSQLRKEPLTNLMVCCGADTNGCWEDRHPQETLRGRADKQAPPWVRPEPEDRFLVSRTWDEDAKDWVTE